MNKPKYQVYTHKDTHTRVVTAPLANLLACFLTLHETWALSRILANTYICKQYLCSWFKTNMLSAEVQEFLAIVEHDIDIKCNPTMFH